MVGSGWARTPVFPLQPLLWFYYLHAIDDAIMEIKVVLCMLIINREHTLSCSPHGGSAERGRKRYRFGHTWWRNLAKVSKLEYLSPNLLESKSLPVRALAMTWNLAVVNQSPAECKHHHQQQKAATSSSAKRKPASKFCNDWLGGRRHWLKYVPWEGMFCTLCRTRYPICTAPGTKSPA